MSIQDQISGALIGAAIGDSFGFIIEKKTMDEAQVFVKELQEEKLKTYIQRTYPQEYPVG